MLSTADLHMALVLSISATLRLSPGLCLSDKWKDRHDPVWPSA
jgi:hypothetical protein